MKIGIVTYERGGVKVEEVSADLDVLAYVKLLGVGFGVKEAGEMVVENLGGSFEVVSGEWDKNNGL